MKKDYVMPIVVMTLLCLAVSGVLAFTNSVTAPIISAAALKREQAALYEMLEDADGFEPVDTGGMAATIAEAYRATNGTGFVFVVEATGYGGNMRIMCAISPDGKMVGNRVVEHNETQGLGSKIEDTQFSGQFNGRDGGFAEVDSISGATISTQAYVGAIRDAFAAYDICAGD